MKLHTTVTAEDVPLITNEISSLVLELQSILVKISANSKFEEPQSTDTNLSAANFIEVIDTLIEQSAQLEEAERKSFRSKLAGVEDLYAMTSGFAKQFSSSGNAAFEVKDRFTGNSVKVALPPLSWQFLAKDLRKTIREFKRYEKNLRVG